jgi:(p)ppGpp synthase/HD superfamily hydrolase
MDMLSAAKSYATLHHVIRKGQLYGLLPYTHHLNDVERVLRSFDESRVELLVAAWLHDIVEDTDVKLRDIEENFGEEVARLVGAVTSEEGANRKVRTALTYPKIREAGADAIRLKLADRIANVANGGASVKMYHREYPDFRFQLHRQSDTLNAPMWNSLDILMEKGKASA